MLLDELRFIVGWGSGQRTNVKSSASFFQSHIITHRCRTNSLRDSGARNNLAGYGATGLHVLLNSGT
jgi:hypothetical protein